MSEPQTKLFCYLFFIVTARNEVGARLLFLHVCVILFIGGVLSQHSLQRGEGDSPPGGSAPGGWGCLALGWGGPGPRGCLLQGVACS